VNFAENVIEVVRYNDRMLKVKIMLGKSLHEIYSHAVYAPHVGRPAQEKVDIQKKLEDEIARVPES
jgi:hypothetical protein